MKSEEFTKRLARLKKATLVEFIARNHRASILEEAERIDQFLEERRLLDELRKINGSKEELRQLLDAGVLSQGEHFEQYKELSIRFTRINNKLDELQRSR